MGYIGYSMSERAAEAYELGQRPLSKWTKAAILDALDERLRPFARKHSVKALREAVLNYCGWPHTSCKYNRTEFYEVLEDADDQARYLLEIEPENEALRRLAAEIAAEEEVRWEALRKEIAEMKRPA